MAQRMAKGDTRLSGVHQGGRQGRADALRSSKEDRPCLPPRGLRRQGIAPSGKLSIWLKSDRLLVLWMPALQARMTRGAPVLDKSVLQPLGADMRLAADFMPPRG